MLMLPDGILLACGGFLLAVLWFDLMFDSQVRGHEADELPEEVLASIASYYRRVTTTANPMGYLVAAVMLILLITLGLQFMSDRASLGFTCVSAVLGVGPIAVGLGRTFSNAVKLGGRAGSTTDQSALARSIYRDHCLCFAGIAMFVAYRLAALPLSAL